MLRTSVLSEETDAMAKREKYLGVERVFCYALFMPVVFKDRISENVLNDGSIKETCPFF